MSTVQELKYHEILSENRRLKTLTSGRPYRIAVLSNTVTHHLNEILEYRMRSEGLSTSVESGQYDNMLEESRRLGGSDAVLIFWEMANLIDGFHSRYLMMDQAGLEALKRKVKAEITLVFEALKETSLVIFNAFSTLVFSGDGTQKNHFDEMADALNDYVRRTAPANTVMIETDKVIAKTGIGESADFRYYYASKSLYAVDFYKNYTEHITPLLLARCGKSLKALVLDCDNTLWKGILGEDGLDGIEMSARTPSGAPYEEVQRLVKSLASKGVLICLASRNNPQDVDEVFRSHPDMVLREEDVAAKAVGWQDKAEGLRRIAADLGVGTDSLALVDDSAFELDWVRDQMPEVSLLRVPRERAEYPAMMRRCEHLFYRPEVTREDTVRCRMIRQESQRRKISDSFASADDYLRSLDLQMRVYFNEVQRTPRMAQLTQKTNQFNLTTRRYTEAQLIEMCGVPHSRVYAFEASDRFGEYGLCGLCVVDAPLASTTGRIDVFLMSCRVLGRRLEYAFMDCVIADLRHTGVEVLEAEYIRTPKNDQVSRWYGDMGFAMLTTSPGGGGYRLVLAEYRPKGPEYIRRNNGK